MEYISDTTIEPPYDDKEYKIKIVDYGQGIKQLSINAIPNGTYFVFHISNSELQECQWRNKQEEIPNNIHKAVEYYGYHITDEENLPQHGLYQNINYIASVVDDIDEELDESDYLAKANIDWVKESLDLLQKIEILKAHITDVEFEVVSYKAYASSKNTPDGLVKFQNRDGQMIATTLRLLVLRMIAYTQNDGFIDIKIIPNSLVEKLVGEPN